VTEASSWQVSKLFGAGPPRATWRIHARTLHHHARQSSSCSGTPESIFPGRLNGFHAFVWNRGRDFPLVFVSINCALLFCEVHTLRFCTKHRTGCCSLPGVHRFDRPLSCFPRGTIMVIIRSTGLVAMEHASDFKHFLSRQAKFLNIIPFRWTLSVSMSQKFELALTSTVVTPQHRSIGCTMRSWVDQVVIAIA
jgi:hypothetical protein